MQQDRPVDQDECFQADGVGPFVSHRQVRLADGSVGDWLSRHHRKRLVLRKVQGAVHFVQLCLAQLWQPGQLNWWIGVTFAIGASLFILGSVLNLSPELAAAFSLSPNEVNAVYFLGSIPFTTAAYLQLFQAANADPAPGEATNDRRGWQVFGWKPHDIGWLSCALQFPGTVLFNFNTFDGLIPSLSWWQSELAVWLPNFVGSVLFLASGYLAFIEVTHRWWAWRPNDLSWWVVLANLAGCIGFMISALFAVVLPGGEIDWMATVATAFTLQGAIGFWIGSLLMLPEAAE
ncbi:hypothetical protein DTL42_17145 [Bremerella cremea]|uniref:YrhK domain-containing protein n=1 Tax=Bremerella cremea TaxID=1031537 RepID=A0A368KN38_9BACT|nr:hypothetical protein [Bremerella cremea]RCS44648.1 hypothetical protein DTL42_17145 [Bremerella cremea]